MIKKLLIFTLFLVFNTINSQEIYLYTGKNFTNYHYKDANGNSNGIITKTNKSHFEGGSHYEAGYIHHFKNNNLSYIAGITLNEFNATYFLSNSTEVYSWKTKYIGIQNLASFSFFNKRSNFNTSIKAGINLSTILTGEQYANGNYFDLSKNEDFKGILFQSIVGLNANYKISNSASLSIGYNLSTVVKTSKTSKESLYFTNSQLQFGIHFPFPSNQN
ncbi:hypothetical protein [Flavobacterium sp. UMI-01]|uniref:hypothetical protein n=1 Tax=Flavobacterium sp. UMI-01 TaxID=1441053 RepID=UPI001C7D66FF|nr:hypothetical protein [Flavobacterium sp. UMI-01]GIZ09081.1 hypothetical protein FUMI01_18080 [Flavobacterium sp. UMI-01]